MRIKLSARLICLSLALFGEILADRTQAQIREVSPSPKFSVGNTDLCDFRLGNTLFIQEETGSLYSISQNDAVEVFDVKTGKKSCTIHVPGGVVGGVCLPESRTILIASPSRIVSLAPDLNRQISTWCDGNEIRELATSRGADVLAILEKGQVRVVDVKRKENLINFLNVSDDMRLVNVTNDATTIFLVGDDNYIYLGKKRAKEIVRSRYGSPKTPIVGMMITRDSMFLVVALMDGSVKKVRVDDMTEVVSSPQVLQGNHSRELDTPVQELNGGTFVTGSSAGKLKFWTQQLQPFREIKGHVSSVRSIVQERKSGLIYSSGGDGLIRKWHPTSLTEISLPGRIPHRLRRVVSRDGKLEVVAATTGGTQVWDLNCGKRLGTEATFGATGSLDVAIDRTVSLIASSRGVDPGALVGPAVLEVHRIGEKKTLFSYSSSNDESALLAPRIRGNAVFFLSLEGDGSLQGWSITSKKQFLAFPGGYSCFDITDDGKLALASGFDGTLSLIDVEKGQLLERVQTQPSISHSIRFVERDTAVVHGQRA